VASDQQITLTYDQKLAGTLLGASGDAGKQIANGPTSLVVIYSYGDFRAATKAARSDDTAATPIEITRESCVPDNKVKAFFSNPFGDLDAARLAPLRIDNALITPLPSQSSGWKVAITLFIFMAFYAIGPGVCVWLALSELMPTRIRSNGMSIALLLNQAVSTGIAAAFLPTVGKYGYSTMFWGFAACTVIYLITAAVFLPETKGKTLEEIEAHFEGTRKKSSLAPA
jgi:MFS transporter, SP family, solute carrier family 2 (myo-inositol transporter), member 13